MSRLIALTVAASLLLSYFVQRSRAASPAPPAKQDAKSVIAVFELTGPVTETPPDELSAIFGGSEGISLKDLVEHMRKAGDDPAVKAVVLMIDGGSIGLAQIEEVRETMKHLRDSGKDVYAHADSLSPGAYLLLCGATRLSVVPTADIAVMGLYGEQPYIRGLLDKLAVYPDFLHCGAYKSAGELFTRDGPSPEADAMMNWLFDSLFQSEVKLIATGRGVDESKAKQWLDEGPYTARSAKDAGLIDAVEQRQDFQAMLKSKFGSDATFDKKYGEKKSEVDLSSPMAIFKIWADLLGGGAQKKKPTTPAIGIVYVDGAIEMGRGEDSPFSSGNGAHSSDLRKALDEAADDDSIKAVVLRVDSPGGSATASEIILDATKRVKAKKPLVVSMGGVAGSGGYYVTCAADTIFADASTITASIGVVSGKLVTTDMWKKVGITFKPYQRGKNAGMLSSYAPFTPEQKQRMQGWMDEIYGVFKEHVTAIRGDKLKKPVDELAGGRVFTGQQALELGLIDRIGTMQDAIEFVAKRAEMAPGYEVRVVPEPKNLIEKILASANEDKGDSKQLSTRPRNHHALADLATPYLKELDPARVAAIREALDRLQLLQDEGVLLVMPDVFVTKH